MQDTYYRKTPFSPPLVRNGGEQQSSNYAAGLEEPIHSRDEASSIAARVQLKVFDEGWLSCRVTMNLASFTILNVLVKREDVEEEQWYIPNVVPMIEAV